MENETRQIQPQKQSCDGPLRKCLRFLRGMPFSFVLLFIIIAACVAGSVIPQDGANYTYIERYGPSAGRLITALRLDHVFTSWWFILLAALLCLNLILCSISRFGAVYRVWKAQERKSFGMWGSWVTHLGMLLLIITFALGQYLTKEVVVYGIAGSTQPLGDTGLSLTIDDFDVALRDDYTVEQYTAALTVTDANGESSSGQASVNHPFDAFGYSFYQDSMGWASYVDIYRDDADTAAPVKTDLICVGEYTYPDEFPGLALLFNKFYPDLAQASDGSFYSATPLPNNPWCLYSVYYNGTVAAMNITQPGQPIPVSNYTFVMRDPVEYTLIVARSNPMVPFVAGSAGILLLGLLLSFYVRPWEVNRRKEHANESDPDNG